MPGTKIRFNQSSSTRSCNPFQIREIFLNEIRILNKLIDKGEIIIYQPDDQSTLLEVRIEEETVWLSQMQMAELFQITRNNVTIHLSNIFKERELEQISVCKDSLLTAQDGKNYRTKFYNLDVIISVGYRVKSQRGTQFRIWANRVLKD